MLRAISGFLCSRLDLASGNGEHRLAQSHPLRRHRTPKRGADSKHVMIGIEMLRKELRMVGLELVDDES
jgi:hypothetical protein